MTNIDDLEDRAVALLDQGRLRRSERVLKQMLELDRSCLGAHFHLARVYRRTGEYELALRHARRTLRLNPEEPNARLNLGLIYDLMGRDKLAVFHYKKELFRNPNSAETHWNIGRLYFRKHRWLQASRHLRRCFELGSTFEIEDTVDKLGIAYHKLNDVHSYIQVFTRYVEIVPNAAWAFRNLGHALVYAKDYRTAVLRFSRANQLEPSKPVDVELARAKAMLLKNGQKMRKQSPP